MNKMPKIYWGRCLWEKEKELEKEGGFSDHDVDLTLRKKRGKEEELD